MSQNTHNNPSDGYDPLQAGDGWQEQDAAPDGQSMTPDAPRHDAGPAPQAPVPPTCRAPASKKAKASGKPPKAKRSRRRRAPREVVRESPITGHVLRGSQMLVYDSELDEVDYTDPDDLPEMRDYLPIRFKRYGRSGIGGGILYALFVISLSIILACFAWMCAVDVLALNKEFVSQPVFIEPYQPTGDMPTTVTTKDREGNEIEVPIQVDIDQVADALNRNGIIKYPWLFKLYAQFSHANIKIDPGTYDLDTSLDYRALVTKMQFGSGAQETVQITFPEGFSLEQIFTLLEQNYVCEKEDLYEASANTEFDYDFLKDLPYGDPDRLEGYLFPDTYEFFQGEGAETAIKRFLNNTRRKLSDEILTAAADRGLSVHELLTMASLIEKEAGTAENERENMASVIYNRLAASMPLGLDSTVNYIKGTSTFDLTAEDLAIDSPYNTYLYQGLPPGPICNPGLASIEAVVDPARTNYYYWYSVDGVSSFFSSYEEQQAFASAHPY